MKFVTPIAIVLGLGMSGSVLANSSDLIMTNVGGELSFDFVNNSSVSALDFSVKLSGMGKLESGSCVSGLPSSHVGQCQFSNGELKVIIYSPTNEVLASGPIGHVVATGDFNKTNAISVGAVNMFNADGSQAQSESLRNANDELKLKELR